MSNGYFVIGGPQAAGKSSAIKYIHSKFYSTVPLLTRGGKGPHVPEYEEEYRNLLTLQEMRQIVLHEHGLLGAIFMQKSDEIEIIENDLRRMGDVLSSADGRVFLDECNVFTLAHSKAHGIDADAYFQDYCSKLKKLDVNIIFLDVPPEVSWQRRKSRYEERTEGFQPEERAKIMKMYRDYIFTLQPLMADLYKTLDFPKRKIDTNVPLEDALYRVGTTFEEMTKDRGIKLVKRF